jgi:hypothetical protein
MLLHLSVWRGVLFVGAFFFALQGYGQDSPEVIKVIPMQAGLMTTDELGNVYVVKKDNTLLRFNDKGDSTAFYKILRHGAMGALDASNPLRLVLYYPTFSKVVLLDRMLSFKAELNLTQINLLNPAAIAASADGNLWVYDKFNAVLRKVDDQLNTIAQSNDLRLQAQIAPDPVFMLERNHKVYLCDPRLGILLFDRFGNYLNTLSVFDVSYLQVFGEQLIYLQQEKEKLYAYNQQTMATQTMPIPNVGAPVISAAIAPPDRLYILYADRLVLYRRPAGKQ